MTKSHAPGVTWRLTWTICSTSPSTVTSEKDHGENKGRPEPQACTPQTGLHLFIFSDLKNICLDLLVMIKAHDKERKTGMQRLKPKRKRTTRNLDWSPRDPRGLRLLPQGPHPPHTSWFTANPMLTATVGNLQRKTEWLTL